MHLKGWQQLKKDKNSGVSLALVLCVSAFFMAFAAAILYTAGLLTAQSNRRIQEERCYQLASSYASVLDAELKHYTEETEKAKGTFYAFVNSFLNDSRYLEYDKTNADSTSYQFVVDKTQEGKVSADTIAKGYGNLCVTLRKEPNEESSMAGTIEVKNGADANYSQAIAEIEKISVREYIVIVDVTAYYGEMSYTYSTEYTRAETYKAVFTHKGTTIVWDASTGKWRQGSNAGQPYDPTADSSEPIRYTFDQSRTTSCQYLENAYTEGGTADGS